ncbi:MAG: bkdB [Sphingomonas bacterium]|nr:bkdB [Sphingomonas bacterium]
MAHSFFRLPDIGEGTAEAELVAWHVTPGQTVEEDQPLADVMTDKATVEITVPTAGKIARLHGAAGDLIQVGALFVEFETDDDAAASAAPPHLASAGDDGPMRSLPTPGDGTRVRASPAVRRRAQEAGVPLENVKGSGPGGRVRQPDLDAHLKQQVSGPATPAAASPVQTTNVSPAPDGARWRDVRITGLRRRIAEKMEISTRRIPHFTYVEEVDVTELEQARALLNARAAPNQPKLSFLPFFIRALCTALQRFPQMNATYDEETGIARYHEPVHLGIATQTEPGLKVPVLREAQSLGLWALAGSIADLSAGARDGSLARDRLAGSTITLTSLGRLGGITTTPVINHPEVAIVGPNRIVERPGYWNGTIALRKIMNISSSFDHRVVDGHDAAMFIQDIKALLQAPLLLLAH